MNNIEKDLSDALIFYWLEIPINNRSDIKKQYKKLCMIHHPDRWWSNENFLKLKEYKDFLLKYYYLINFDNIKLKKELEKIIRENSKQKQFLLWNYIKHIKISIHFSFNVFLDKFIYYFFEIIEYLLKKITYFLVYSFLFFLAILPLSSLTEKFEPRYYEKWYIIESGDVYMYSEDWLSNLWEYTEDYNKHNIPINLYLDTEERKKDILSLFLKQVSLYGLLLVIYSIIYFMVLKKIYKNIIFNITNKINNSFWNIKINFKFKKFEIKDRELETFKVYKVFLIIIKEIQIYYFIFLYLFVFLITNFIYLIF